MYVLCSERGNLINFDKVVGLYVSSDGLSIRVEMENGKSWKVGNYQSLQETKEALEILSNKLNEKQTLCFPTRDEVKAKMNNQSQSYHHATGKKTKGYGGS